MVGLCSGEVIIANATIEMVEIAGESSGFAARYHFLGNERLFLGNVRLFLGQEMVFLRLVVNLLGL